MPPRGMASMLTVHYPSCLSWRRRKWMTTLCCSRMGPSNGIATPGSAASESMIAGRGIWIVASRARERERESVCVCVKEWRKGQEAKGEKRWWKSGRRLLNLFFTRMSMVKKREWLRVHPLARQGTPGGRDLPFDWLKFLLHSLACKSGCPAIYREIQTASRQTPDPSDASTIEIYRKIRKISISYEKYDFPFRKFTIRRYPFKEYSSNRNKVSGPRASVTNQYADLEYTELPPEVEGWGHAGGTCTANIDRTPLPSYNMRCSSATVTARGREWGIQISNSRMPTRVPRVQRDESINQSICRSGIYTLASLVMMMMMMISVRLCCWN